MTDYISREEVLSLTRDICVPTKWGTEYRHWSIDPSAVSELPAADVREVKRGRWRLIGADKRGLGGIFVCSVCDRTFPYKTNFCPNCGTDMRDATDEKV